MTRPSQSSRCTRTKFIPKMRTTVQNDKHLRCVTFMAFYALPNVLHNTNSTVDFDHRPVDIFMPPTSPKTYHVDITF